VVPDASTPSSPTAATTSRCWTGPDSFSPDWQPLVGPRREDFKSASHFCKAEHEFLAEGEFKRRYGGGANAHAKCVSSTNG